MAKLPGNLEACGSILLSLVFGHVPAAFTTLQGAGLARQGEVALLGVGMAEPVRVAQSRLEGLIFIASELFGVGAVGRDQRAVARDQAADVHQHSALGFRNNGYRSCATAFRPTGLEHDAVCLDRIRRLKLDRLFTAQAERDLEQDRCPDQWARDLLELSGIEFAGTVDRRFGLLGQSVGGIVTFDDVGLVDAIGPPSEPGKAVADGGVIQVITLPVFDQRVDVPCLERAGTRQAVAKSPQISGHRGEAAQSVLLCAVGAVAVMTAHAAQVHREIVHQSLPVLFLSVSVDGRRHGRSQSDPQSVSAAQDRRRDELLSSGKSLLEPVWRPAGVGCPDGRTGSLNPVGWSRGGDLIDRARMLLSCGWKKGCEI